MDKSREQFEQFIQRKFGDLIDQRVTKNGDGEYFSWDMQVAWLSWQASRAAIELELPDSTEFDGPDMSGAQQAISQIREKLNEIGIKVKE